jgi:hypothetical protein
VGGFWKAVSTANPATECRYKPQTLQTKQIINADENAH